MHDKPYRQIVILSGKGGTGKTTFVASFAKLLQNKIVIDCDVDAANLHLVLDNTIKAKHDFYGGKKAQINLEKCNRCGLCESVCRFDAINNFVIEHMKCEGCGFCFRICPVNAIDFNLNKSGLFFESELTDNSKFIYARLNPGEGNSGKLVSEIKKRAFEDISDTIEWVLVDGPPGIGCPVNASLAGVDYVVIVTEPTLSGFHDMKRLVELLEIFKIPCGILINKYDLNETITLKIFKYSASEKIPIIGSIPFDPEFVKALINGKNIVEVNETIRKEILTIWRQLEQQVEITVN